MSWVYFVHVCNSPLQLFATFDFGVYTAYFSNFLFVSDILHNRFNVSHFLCFYKNCDVS